MTIFNNLKEVRENQFREHRYAEAHEFFGYIPAAKLDGSSDVSIEMYREGRDGEQEERPDALYVRGGGIAFFQLDAAILDTGAADSDKLRYTLHNRLFEVVYDANNAGFTINTVASAETESTTGASVDSVDLVAKDTNGLVAQAIIDDDGVNTSGNIFVNAKATLLAYVDDYPYLKYGKYQVK
jgi:hypothetical protein